MTPMRATRTGIEGMRCPNDHEEMKMQDRKIELVFRDVRISYKAMHYVCPVCGLEADDIELAKINQRAISEAYRKRVGLLTSDEIIEGRKRLGWSQHKIAKAIDVGIASIKRWESGQIQTRAMDQLLRRVLKGREATSNPYTGNRTLSLARIKLVLKEFSKRLGRELLSTNSNDKLLYSAKYLWYVDMIAFREIGQSMTGATYAALPYGPQLNNYRELVDDIRKANEKEAEALSELEKRIIARIAMAFPNNRSIYEAAHREEIWKSKQKGELIPYTDAHMFILIDNLGGP